MLSRRASGADPPPGIELLPGTDQKPKSSQGGDPVRNRQRPPNAGQAPQPPENVDQRHQEKHLPRQAHKDSLPSHADRLVKLGDREGEAIYRLQSTLKPCRGLIESARKYFGPRGLELR